MSGCRGMGVLIDDICARSLGLDNAKNAKRQMGKKLISQTERMKGLPRADFIQWKRTMKCGPTAPGWAQVFCSGMWRPVWGPLAHGQLGKPRVLVLEEGAGRSWIFQH